jgi:transcriptional regulator with XRE-family HTH domain
MRGVVELREALDLKQKELADYLRVSTQMVGLVETHQREFSADPMSRLRRLELTYFLAKAATDRALEAELPPTAPPTLLLTPVIELSTYALSPEQQQVLGSVLTHPDAQATRQAYFADLNQKLLRRKRTLRQTIIRYAGTLYKYATLEALKVSPPTDESFARTEAGWIMMQLEKPAQLSAETLRAEIVKLHLSITALEWEIGQL